MIRFRDTLAIFSSVAFLFGYNSGSGERQTECPDGGEYCLKDAIKNCQLTPQSSEGPFFLPNQPVRSDVREGRPGVPLNLEFIVKDKKCQPVEGAYVHLWQADALGFYSAYLKYYPLGDPGSMQITGPHAEPSEADATFLRGIQITDVEGKAKFTTIYPGWYTFRALHLHFKITLNGKDKYTGELYFPDKLTDEINKLEPYNQRKGKGKRRKNEQDGQFVYEHGKELLMHPRGNPKDGLDGSMQIIISK